MSKTSLNVYERMQLEALNDRREVQEEVQQVIEQHKTLHASKAVLNGLFQLAGSYSIRDLAKLELHKITENEQGTYPSIGTSRSGRKTKNLLVYLKNEQGTIDTYGWDTFEKHIQLFDFKWTTLPQEISQKGVEHYKQEAQTRAVKEYLTSLDEARKQPERIKDIQSVTERNKVISLLGLEERIEHIVKESTQSLGSFLNQHDVDNVLTPEFLHLIEQKGTYHKQAEKLRLSTQAQTALARLNDKNLILTNEEYAQDTQRVLEETNKIIPYPATLLIGDYLSDFKEIASQPVNKQKRFQQAIDLIRITKVIEEENPVMTFAEADLVWSAFDIPHHRITNYEETKNLSQVYKEDYQQGSSIAKNIFMPEGKWASGSKTAPPTRSTFKNIPIIATYKTNGSDALKSIMRHERNLYAAQEKEEQAILSKNMASTREAMDNIVVLARIKKMLEEKGYDATTKDATTAKKVKERFYKYAENKKPNERFAKEQGISLSELVNRIQTIEAEKITNHPTLTSAFYPDNHYHTPLPGALKELQEAVKNKIYKEDTIKKIKQEEYDSKPLLTQLVNLQQWSEEDTKNYNRIKKIKEHPSVIEDFKLPWTATPPTTYISPEQSTRFKEFKDLEKKLDDVNEWEGMEETIQQYQHIRNKHQKGYTLISQTSEGFKARKEYKATRKVYEKNIDDNITIIDPERKEELKQEMKQLQAYEPLTADTLQKAKNILSKDSKVNQQLKEKGIKPDGQTWYQLRNIWEKADNITVFKFRNKYLENFYIAKTLVTEINNIYKEAQL